jgi:hypothetical protein
VKKTNPTLGPRPSVPREQTGQQAIIDIKEYMISFDPEAFDDFIRSQGIRVVHYKAIPDPTGMISKSDVYASNSTKSNSDGFLYQKAGTCQVLFSNNNKTYNLLSEGASSLASAFITPPRFYDDGTEVSITVYDRLYLSDIEIKVVAFHFVEANTNGIDRLQYPAVKVEYLVDANGVQYKQDVDFCITEDGYIKWLHQKRPGWNITANRGTVYSIRYLYTPFFVAQEAVHEIRIAQVSDPVTFDRNVVRMPFAIRVMRENVFKDENRDPNRPIDTQRYQDAPSAGGALGPK